MTNNSNNQWTS